MVRFSALRARRWAAFCAAFCAAFWSAPAGAYVRTRTADTLVPYFWSDPFQTLEVAQPPDVVGLSAVDVVGAATAAAAAWSYPAIPCSGVSLRVSPGVVDSQVAGLDGHNRIIMRTDRWCRDPIGMTNCHDPMVIALTTVFTRSHPGAANDGQILEADIEVNAVDDFFAIIPASFMVRDYADKYDLASVLTHETGHFIGLAHDCQLPSDTPRQLTDDQGNQSPDCDALPATTQTQILQDTMYPWLNLADVSARTLTADDTRASCEIYPPLVVGGGCVTAPSSRMGPVLSLVAVTVFMTLIVVAARRRRARRGVLTARAQRL